LPAVDDAVRGLDPQEACQRAIEEGLIVHRGHPLNCETSIPALIGGVVMPNAHFYVRDHFHIPKLDPSTWRLAVGGQVERPLSLSLRDLRNMRSETEVVTLECAGNGRTRFEPAIEGEKWDLGAVSTAEWTGVPLVEVLDRAGVKSAAREILFRGADSGAVSGQGGAVNFERSLRVDDARNPGVLLAYAMNGEPLPVQHGFPVRVVVPGWYAMTSVKWLTDIEAIERPFTGHFQGTTYVYEWPDRGRPAHEPVTLQRVRSLITEPPGGAAVDAGELAIRGVAWSGAARIARVDVSIGDGPWQAADLVGESNPHSWQWWELLTRLDLPGETTVRARATDFAGRVQPEEGDWNRLGYGNNASQVVPVHVRG
jgi:DMSO/TMAO reductase YedYZ molybdopterin-dependent catalytic subunit